MKQLLTALTMVLAANYANAEDELPGVDVFIDEMVIEHQFDKQALQKVFEQVEVKQPILKAISKPAEKSKPWYEYRNIFIQDSRINGGVSFWKKHAADLARAEQVYGVPAEIIVAILGVETRYGGNVGSYRVIDALSTLAFRYPPRSKFFRSELKHFFVLTREEEMSQLTPIGSYAGAMGLGQFMPSSYRAYAVDFDADKHRDIWNNPTDAIGSIANYLKRHGWIANQSIVHKADVKQAPTSLIEKGLKPSLSRQQLTAAGVDVANLPVGDDSVSIFSLTQKSGEEYWVARQNFYSITRYNHSRMYAMVVTQLAEAIRNKYEQH
jgi:membrane-bound lytic murein transglycosylase B